MTVVMGSSGAGKSSLLGLLTDFEQPDSGSLSFRAPDTASDLPVFWSPQDHGLWPHLSVREHLEYVMPSDPRAGRSVEQWLQAFQLESLSSSLPATMSQGERSRLGVVRALASEAAVLVLDEPMVHVDPMMAHHCWQIVREHAERHCVAVVFSAHDPDTVLKHAERVLCLSRGRLSYSGPVSELYLEPPTRELGWLLGPCNWFSSNGEDGCCPAAMLEDLEMATSLNSNPDQADALLFRIRPSFLEVRRALSGRFTVVSILRAMSCAEVRLHDADSGRCYDVFADQIHGDVKSGDSVAVVCRPET